jgi:hypothetical protein
MRRRPNGRPCRKANLADLRNIVHKHCRLGDALITPAYPRSAPPMPRSSRRWSKATRRRLRHYWREMRSPNASEGKPPDTQAALKNEKARFLCSRSGCLSRGLLKHYPTLASVRPPLIVALIVG